jgi:hypothetical protein
MKYRATCPECGVKFPRAYFFKWLPHARRLCESCGCTYRVNSFWEWTADIIGGMAWATFFLLALFGFISWPAAVILILGISVLGYAIFPYVTPFDLVERAQKHKDVPSV